MNMVSSIINIRELKQEVTKLINYKLDEKQKEVFDNTFLYFEKLQEQGINLQFEKCKIHAEILLNETGAGNKTLCATLIYSIQEKNTIDTNIISEEICPIIGEIISGLLKIPILKKEKYAKNIENFIKLLLTVTGDVRAVLIRLIQQIYTMRYFESFNNEEQIIAAQQTASLFAPLAHRLGLYKIKTELEETAMKYTENEMYKFIAKKLSETKRVRDLYIKNFIEPVEKSLIQAGFKFTIKGRPKSIFSIWNKMKKQAVPFEEVYDLFAIRIILDSPLEQEKDNCWKVYSIITDTYKPNPKRLRDWISAPKAAGYESLHTTVLGSENKWLEIQIRTERMDEIAENGPAAHWKYKDSGSSASSDWLTNMRDAIENPLQDDDTNNKAKAALYSNEIFVFTPEGDLRSVKKGYTVLDFAFSIHTKIGETCTGAIVNDKIKTLNYEINNGDTVKILTSKNKRPNADWLNIAKSTRVKNKIKQLLKLKDNKSSEQGKETLKQKLAQLKVEFTEANTVKLCEYFNCESPIILYQQIGENKIDSHKIKKAFESINEKAEKKADLKEIKNSIFEENITKANKFNDYLLIDENLSTLDYSLSKCCNPILGDKIFGFITVAKGTRIHKESCPNAKDLKHRYPYRIVKAKWNVKNIDTNFISNIYIAGKDKLGITAAITNIITLDFKIKLKAITINERKNEMFDGAIVVYIKNRKQITELIERLRKIKDIQVVKEQ